MYGRPERTPQRWSMVSSVPSSSTQTVSVTVKSPERTSFTVPETPAGTMILCSRTLVSGTVPMTSPGMTASPGLTVGVNVHFFSRSSAGTSTPRVMVWPVRAMIFSSGRWMPS